MPRLYLVTADTALKKHRRFTGSQAEARAAKADLAAAHAAKRSELSVEEVEVPTGKQDLVHYLNELVK